jgi:hypothetical protein
MSNGLTMKRIMITVLALGLAGCNAAKQTTPTATTDTQLSGAWEFQLSTQPTPVSSETVLLETVLTPQGGQFAALSNNLMFITDVQSNSTYYQFGTICSPGQEVLSGQVGQNGSLSLAFSDPLDTYTGTGQVVSATSVSGTYSGSSSSDCPYSGSFTGTSVQPLSGTFSGTLSLSNATDTLTATLNQSALSLTVTGTSTGTDNGSFTLQGVATANSFQIEGTIGSNNVSLAGIYVPGQKAIYLSEVCTQAPCSNGYYAVGELTLQ